MGTAATHHTFRSWLGARLEEQQMPRRELARRLAAKHPAGVNTQTIETYRRAIYRYLDPSDPMLPSEQTRAAFADAFGVSPDEVPSGDDEEPDLAASLQALVREQLQLARRIERALKASA